MSRDTNNESHVAWHPPQLEDLRKGLEQKAWKIFALGPMFIVIHFPKGYLTDSIPISVYIGVGMMLLLIFTCLAILPSVKGANKGAPWSKEKCTNRLCFAFIIALIVVFVMVLEVLNVAHIVETKGQHYYSEETTRKYSASNATNTKSLVGGHSSSPSLSDENSTSSSDATTPMPTTAAPERNFTLVTTREEPPLSYTAQLIIVLISAAATLLALILVVVACVNIYQIRCFPPSSSSPPSSAQLQVPLIRGGGGRRRDEDSLLQKTTDFANDKFKSNSREEEDEDGRSRAEWRTQYPTAWGKHDAAEKQPSRTEHREPPNGTHSQINWDSNWSPPTRGTNRRELQRHGGNSSDDLI